MKNLLKLPEHHRYGVIIADPPWQYAQSGIEGAASAQYDCMTTRDLLALPVAQWAAENSVLLLWATWPKLAEACLPVLTGWGFEYVTGFPWIKVTEAGRSLWGDVQFSVQYGVGFWARGCSEMVLIGRRGQVSPPTEHFVGLLSPNLRHSRKPDSLYEYAESLPGPYLELFARRARPGWDAWGSEAPNAIELDTEMAGHGALTDAPEAAA